ncbi:hypothetical protein M413DRAFT_377684 [Hebeloma cylindrosporum]|uniref:Uncharacterized protein n=1 Tax=Hebeloma cylindrosporum TaxID=76867 RepID=A0A0C3CJI0_HEBCY|nr:hypothetical protein M413DRAFT_377684 [Hebeloma cylindrosporum h7]
MSNRIATSLCRLDYLTFYLSGHDYRPSKTMVVYIGLRDGKESLHSQWFSRKPPVGGATWRQPVSWPTSGPQIHPKADHVFHPSVATGYRLQSTHKLCPTATSILFCTLPGTLGQLRPAHRLWT